MTSNLSLNNEMKHLKPSLNIEMKHLNPSSNNEIMRVNPSLNNEMKRLNPRTSAVDPLFRAARSQSENTDVSESHTKPQQPTSESPTEPQQPTSESPTEQQQPTSESPTEQQQPTSESPTEQQQPTSESPTEQQQPTSESHTEPQEPTSEIHTAPQHPTSESHLFLAPSEELTQRIVLQVEDFFSDFNVMKDKFLLKHIRRNKEGYVNLKLISSLRKVKALTKDWRVVARSLETSERLEMNAGKTKVRRKDPLPPARKEPRIVFVYNVSGNIDLIKAVLSQFGKIVSLSFRDMDAHSVYFKRFAPNAPVAGVLVEFESSVEAEKITAYDSAPDRKFSVVLLDGPLRQEEHPAQEKVSGHPLALNRQHLQKPEEKRLGKNSRANERMHATFYANPITPAHPGSYSGPYLEAKWMQQAHAHLGCAFGKADGDPWSQRKFCNRYWNGVVVVRHPRGPDGTTGFHTGWKTVNDG